MLSIEKTSLKNGISPFASDSYWTYSETMTHRITWGEGANAFIVATAIAGVLPNITFFKIISVVGYAALGVIGLAGGGTVVCDVYYHPIPQTGKIELRYDWTFNAPTGDVYGPFTYFQY